MMNDTVTTPGAREEKRGSRTTVWRPVIHEVVHDGVKAQKGRVVWSDNRTSPSRKKALRSAFMSWAEGKHLDEPDPDKTVPDVAGRDLAEEVSS